MKFISRNQNHTFVLRLDCLPTGNKSRINVGLVMSYVKLSLSLWKIYNVQFEGMVYQQIAQTTCMFHLSRIFILSNLQKSKRFYLIDNFIDNSRFPDDIFTINNLEFETNIPDIYPIIYILYWIKQILIIYWIKQILQYIYTYLKNRGCQRGKQLRQKCMRLHNHQIIHFIYSWLFSKMLLYIFQIHLLKTIPITISHKLLKLFINIYLDVQNTTTFTYALFLTIVWIYCRYRYGYSVNSDVATVFCTEHHLVKPNDTACKDFFTLPSNVLKLTSQHINRRHIYLILNLSLCTHYSEWTSCLISFVWYSQSC